MRKSFTLAEIMIALTIIGVITAILLPVAKNCLPNEKVMKFKKANATLARVINELVTSGEYYTPGDLGMKPDGALASSATDFCETFSDIITAKSTQCSNSKTGAVYYSSDAKYMPDGSIETSILDNSCATHTEAGEEITTHDGVIFYSTCPAYSFGITKVWIHGYSYEKVGRVFKDYKDDKGFIALYKIFCMDIDGIDKGEDPFGYGIRADGKIILGARAQEWLEKDIQDKE